jgi:hypothetical protein
VRADHYLMMSDKRDSSDDSRHWGFVLEDHIHGKAFLFVVTVVVTVVLITLRVAPSYIEHFRVVKTRARWRRTRALTT